MVDGRQHRLGVAALPSHDAYRDLGRLPRIVAAGLGDGDVELVMQTVLQTLQHRPLVLEGVSAWKVQLEGAHTDDHGLEPTEVTSSRSTRACGRPVRCGRTR